MSAPMESKSPRTPNEENRKKIMSHERERRFRAFHSLHKVLAAAEADIIRRKGPNWRGLLSAVDTITAEERQAWRAQA